MVARVPGNPNANKMLTRKKSLAAMMDLPSGGEMLQIAAKCQINLSFAPQREILQRGARCSLDRRFRNQRGHTTMKVVVNGVRRPTPQLNTIHTLSIPLFVFRCKQKRLFLKEIQ